MQNKASPYAQPISHSFPTPRTYEGKLYYGAVDVAKILGVITLLNAAPYATIRLAKEYIAAKDGVQRFKYSNPPKGANPTKGVFLYERFES